VQQTALAIRQTSKSGTTAAIYHLHGIDAEAIAEAGMKTLKDTAEETIQISPRLLDEIGNSSIAQSGDADTDREHGLV
jgi:hypothetical protein